MLQSHMFLSDSWCLAEGSVKGLCMPCKILQSQQVDIQTVDMMHDSQSKTKTGRSWPWHGILLSCYVTKIWSKWSEPVDIVQAV